MASDTNISEQFRFWHDIFHNFRLIFRIITDDYPELWDTYCRDPERIKDPNFDTSSEYPHITEIWDGVIERSYAEDSASTLELIVAVSLLETGIDAYLKAHYPDVALQNVFQMIAFLDTHNLVSNAAQLHQMRAFRNRVAHDHELYARSFLSREVGLGDMPLNIVAATFRDLDLM